jgi:peroxiredoxin family protein
VDAVIVMAALAAAGVAAANVDVDVHVGFKALGAVPRA